MSPAAGVWKRFKRALTSGKELKSLSSCGSSSSDDVILFPCPPWAVHEDLGKRQHQEDCWQAVAEIGTAPSCSRSSSSDGLADVTIEVSPSSPASGDKLKRGCSGIATSVSVASSAPSSSGAVLHFFGMFDGHGGADVSRHCARAMHLHLASRLRQSQLGITTPASPTSATPTDPVYTALKAAYKATDDEVAPPRGPGADIGSTAVVALLGATQVYIANAGDSRAVLVRSHETVPLTQDQKSTRQDEVDRIVKMGGNIRGGRVMGVVTLSRAIGDHALRPYVMSEPECARVTRTKEDQLLILASDGLWDVLSNKEAGEIALMRFKAEIAKGVGRKRACLKASQALVKAALAAGTLDNTTVMVIDVRL